MKKTGGVVSLKKLKLFNFQKCDAIKISFAVIMFIGIIIGLIISSKNNQIGEMGKKLFNILYGYKSIDNIIKNIIYSFIFFFLINLLVLIFGASAFGIVTLPIFTICIYSFFGMILSYSYKSYNFKGLAYNSVLIIPTLVVFSIAYLISIDKTFNFSFSLINGITKKGYNRSLYEGFTQLLKKQTVINAWFLVASVVECLIDNLFIGGFDF